MEQVELVELVAEQLVLEILLEEMEQIILVVAVVAGSASTVDSSGGNGGSGVVILRMADTDYSGTTTGSPTVNTNVGGSGETVIIFNDSGSYTAQDNYMAHFAKLGVGNIIEQVICSNNL
jgi:hypothetical protein